MSARKLLVSVSVADVRCHSSHGSELTTQAVLGVELAVMRSTRDRAWHQVELPDGYVGWIRSWSAKEVSPSELRKWKQGIAFQVSRRSLLFRERPSEGSAVLCELVIGTRLPKLGSRAGWIKTALPDSQQGWIERSGLEALPVPLPTPSSIVRTALRFMGAPYLWGGTTPWGCDCSGLVQTVYSLNGVALPRDARDQLTVTSDSQVNSEAEALRAGDLLFFGHLPGRISHVGISTGGSSFVHSRGNVRPGSLRKGELGYSLELSRFLQAITRPLKHIKKTVDKKKVLQ